MLPPEVLSFPLHMVLLYEQCLTVCDSDLGRMYTAVCRGLRATEQIPNLWTGCL